jgi:hypothetical protein
MRIVVVESEQHFSATPTAVFPFFAEARNLGMLTPSWLGFEVLTPAPIAMESGTLIDYPLRWRGLPIRRRTENTDWKPPYRFVDE